MLSLQSSRPRRQKRPHNKKEKKLIKLIKNDSETEGEESEHELSFYMKDRVKLMKEVLKIIKPKKIRSMAPDCMRDLDNEEINSRLLEELLGISDKRLKYIFTGQNLNEDSSSTDPEAEDEPIDLISLDDISDGDLVIDLDSDKEKHKKQCKKHRTKIKEEHKRKKLKKEKPDKQKLSKNAQNAPSNKTSEENLMSVLELLELQARARAIKSQLVLEKQQEKEKHEIAGKDESDNDNDAVIVESPKNDEIIISSSDSDDDQHHKIVENREEPVDFWCGTRDENIDKSEQEKGNQNEKNRTDDIVQDNAVTEIETPGVVHEMQTVSMVLSTKDNRSDLQSCTSLNIQSKPVDVTDDIPEAVDITDIPLPEPEETISVGDKDLKKVKDRKTPIYRKKSKSKGSDISEGEIGSTDDENCDSKSVNGEVRTQNNDHTEANIEVQMENNSNISSGDSSAEKVGVVQKKASTIQASIQQNEQLIDEETVPATDQEMHIEKSAADQETNLEKSAEDIETNYRELAENQGTMEKQNAKNISIDREFQDQKSSEEKMKENEGDLKNENLEIPSTRKSKRLSSKLLLDTSIPTNEGKLSAKRNIVGKKKAKLSKKSKEKDVQMDNTERNNSSDDEERIVLNVEQSELDSVNLD
ncbi:unnamed protein product [Phaedon cochleariae]|uniref:Uncharacterized protein n=1 Tax=Phaedon cochleariae TaxID=80249 RepID=A0A9P0DX07_PHACE|nr:unnamed protein product [Phaedon cochleariae]